MAQVVVACPNCSTRLSVNRTTTVAVQFKCTRCGQLIKLAAQAAKTASDVSTRGSTATQRPARTQGPAPEASSNAPADFDFGQLPAVPTADAYHESYLAASHTVRRRPKRSINWLPLLLGFACLFGAAGLGFIGFAVYRWFPVDAISSLNPILDSHASLLSRLNGIASSMVAVLDSVQDDSSRQAAIGRLQALLSEARELQSRATRLGEVDEQEFDRLVSQFNSEAAAIKERLRSATTNLRQRNQMSSELSESGVAMAFAMDDIATAMQIGWKQLPIPENKAEELVHHKTEIQRDMWRAVAAVTSKDEYDKLADRLATFPDRFRKLRDLQLEVSKLGRSGESVVTKYNRVSLDVSFQLADLRNKQEALYGSNSALQAQRDAIEKAEAELIGMQTAGGPRSRQGMPMPDGPPRYVGPNGPPVVPRTAEESITLMLDQFKHGFGAENTVVLRIRSKQNLQARAGEIVDKVTTDPAGNNNKQPRSFYAPHDGNTTHIVFMYKGTVGEVASRVDFGKVVSVDALKREVVVDHAD